MQNSQEVWTFQLARVVAASRDQWHPPTQNIGVVDGFLQNGQRHFRGVSAGAWTGNSWCPQKHGFLHFVRFWIKWFDVIFGHSWCFGRGFKYCKKIPLSSLSSHINSISGVCPDKFRSFNVDCANFSESLPATNSIQQKVFKIYSSNTNQ